MAACSTIPTIGRLRLRRHGGRGHARRNCRPTCSGLRAILIATEQPNASIAQCFPPCQWFAYRQHYGGEHCKRKGAAVAVQTEESEPGRAPEARVSVVEATGIAGATSKAPGSREATRVEAELAVRRQVVAAPARTGGRQRRKARLRRQAAAAGVDVWDWEEVRSQLTIALARRLGLDCAQEKWSRERSGQQGDATGAEERFRQAAWATGVTSEVE